MEAEHTTEVSDIWAKCLESQAQASPMLQSTALSLVQSHRHSGQSSCHSLKGTQILGVSRHEAGEVACPLPTTKS